MKLINKAFIFVIFYIFASPVFIKISFALDEKIKIELENTSVFPLGVASGDPLINQVIIWTKINSNEDSANVKYQLSENDDFKKITTEGSFLTNKERDYTIKVDVKNLKQNHKYFYRFIYNNHFSQIGKTKTLPVNAKRFKIAVTSCQNFSDGYFTAYDHIVKDNPDLVFMLGDFIYEYSRTPAIRPDPSGYSKDLESYRKKYKVYLTDRSLQKARQNIPFVSIWDDHEVVNDYSGVDMLKNDPRRLLSAYKAYFEYLPIREIDNYRIYKNFKIGNLLEVFMLDGRQYRDKDLCQKADTDIQVSPINFDCTRKAKEKGRTYLGQVQKDWLINGLEESNATWKLIGNNTAMLELSLWDNLFNFDQWDGFFAEKEELINTIEKKVKNLLLVTGDIHTFFDADIRYKGKTIAKEVTVTSVSTRSHPILKIASWIVPLLLSHIKYMETSYRGYIITEFDTRKAYISMYGLNSIEKTESQRFLLRSIELKRK